MGIIMASMPHNFGRGFIIITSICAKIHWLKLAGYCPWTILFGYLYNKNFFRAFKLPYTYIPEACSERVNIA